MPEVSEDPDRCPTQEGELRVQSGSRWPQLSDKQEFLPPSGSASASLSHGCPWAFCKAYPLSPQLFSPWKSSFILLTSNIVSVGVTPTATSALTFQHHLANNFSVGTSPGLSPEERGLLYYPLFQTASGNAPSSRVLLSPFPAGPVNSHSAVNHPPSWLFTVCPLVF